MIVKTYGGRALIRRNSIGQAYGPHASGSRMAARASVGHAHALASAPMTYRVIQWATGGVGRAAIEGVLDHPELELVGCWVHSADKDGRDVGEIIGRAARSA